MSVTTNFHHPLRTGMLRLNKRAQEKFGTVVKAGVNDKTVTVEVSNYAYNKRYRKWFAARMKFHCHDEHEESCVGDKVIICQCLKLSARKHMYVKRIILPIGRNAFYQGKFAKDELDAIELNQEIRDSYKNKLLL